MKSTKNERVYRIFKNFISQIIIFRIIFSNRIWIGVKFRFGILLLLLLLLGLSLKYLDLIRYLRLGNGIYFKSRMSLFTLFIPHGIYHGYF